MVYHRCDLWYSLTYGSLSFHFGECSSIFLSSALIGIVYWGGLPKKNLIGSVKQFVIPVHICNLLAKLASIN